MPLDLVLNCCACVLYLAAAALTLKAFRQANTRVPVLMRPTLGCALFAHAATLAHACVGGLHMGFAVSLSAAFFLAVIITWCAAGLSRVFAPLCLLLPGAALALWLPQIWPGAPVPPQASVLYRAGIYLLVLAMAVMLIAVFFAAMVELSDRKLRRAEADGPGQVSLIGSLPPLLVLERVLFYQIKAGFALLTAAVAADAVTLQSAPGTLAVDHKLFILAVSWVLFGVLLAGRYAAGWRGRTVGRCVLAGFILMAVAMLGYSIAQGV